MKLTYEQDGRTSRRYSVYADGKAIGWISQSSGHVYFHRKTKAHARWPIRLSARNIESLIKKLNDYID